MILIDLVIKHLRNRNFNALMHGKLKFYPIIFMN